MSNNSLAASEYFMRNFLDDGYKFKEVYETTSVFLIRQSIELWLKEVTQIIQVIDDNGHLMPLQPEFLLKCLIDLKIHTPFDLNIVKKVHAWTQVTVHGGWSRNLWEIELAQEILSPIIQSKFALNQKSLNEIDSRIKDYFNHSNKFSLKAVWKIIVSWYRKTKKLQIIILREKP